MGTAACHLAKADQFRRRARADTARRSCTPAAGHYSCIRAESRR